MIDIIGKLLKDCKDKRYISNMYPRKSVHYKLFKIISGPQIDLMTFVTVIFVLCSLGNWGSHQCLLICSIQKDKLLILL